jgi:hypothetical protein
MAEGALGISTGIGQGEAQIIKPFQSPVTAQQYGSVMAAQQKAQQDAAAKKAKVAASIADFQFKGLPQHAELFAKGYDDVVNYVIENINDPLIEFKAKQRMSDLNTKANMSADLKANLQKQADFVQQGQGKNYYLGFDEAVKEVVTPIDYTTFQDTNKFGQAIGGKANLLNGVKTIPIYDVGAAKASLLNQVGKWADINTQGRISETPDNVIDSYVEAELMGHPNAYATFEKLMKNDPVGAKAANNQVDKYAFNALKKDLKAKSFTVGSNTTVNITNTPADNELGIGGVYNNQGYLLGGGRHPKYGKEMPSGEMLMSGFSFTPKNAISLQPSQAFDVTTYSRPNTKGNLQLKTGQVALVNVASKDIYVPKYGITIPAGTPIPDGGDMYEEIKDLNIPLKKDWYVVGVDDNLKKTIAVPFSAVRSAIEGGLTKTGLELFNKNLDELKGIYGVGVPQSTVKTTGGTKTTTKAKSSSFNMNVK